MGVLPNTVSGVALQVGDRVLVATATDPRQNGIYVVDTVGTGGDGVWTRAPDFDTNSEVFAGIEFRVTEGTEADSLYLLTTPDPIVLGTTPLTIIKEGDAPPPALTVLEDGVPLGTVDALNFTGPLVGVTVLGTTATVQISPDANQPATCTLIAGEAITAGDVVALDVVQSEVRAVLARADGGPRARPQLVSLENAEIGNTLQGVLLGISELHTEAGLTSLDLGRTLYLSSMPGRATRDPPSAPGTAVVEIGTILSVLASDRARVLFRTQRISVNL